MHFARAFIPYKEAKANFFLRLLELVQLEKTKNKLHFFFFESTRQDDSCNVVDESKKN